MAARKYWLQLPQTYFTRLSQRKMRKQPDGEIMQIIYLKLLLACIGNSGLIFYQGIYDSLSEEIAEEIDEEPEIVQKTIDYILENNMAREIEDEIGGGYFFPESDELTGSESESAERVRRFRKKVKALQCNGDVTESDGDVTDSNDNKVKNNKVNVKKNIIDSSLHFTKDEDASAPPADAGAAHSPFTFADVKDCAEENDIDLTEKQLENFYSWMEKYNWTISGRKVTKLENALSGYAKKHPKYSLDKVGPEEPKTSKKKTQSKLVIEDEIYKIAGYYISQELFDENPGGHHTIISRFCPREDFTEEQLEYMADKWFIWPKSMKFTELDERSEYYHDLHLEDITN